jgi:hypothetical protein
MAMDWPNAMMVEQRRRWTLAGSKHVECNALGHYEEGSVQVLAQGPGRAMSRGGRLGGLM